MVNNGLETDQVAFRTLCAAMYRLRYICIAWLILVAGVAVYVALQLPNQYRSVATLVANEPSGKLSGISASLGSVGSLAGLGIGGGTEKKSVVAIEMMKSRQFFSSFLQKNDIKLALMAASDWDPVADKLLYDEQIYDTSSATWVRKPIGLRHAEPSVQECFEAFMRIFSVSQDKLTGVVTLSIEFMSPPLAQQWLQLYIDEVNLQMRLRDVKEAEDSIRFIEDKIQNTDLAEVRAVMYSMLEEHHKTLVVANIRSDYVFKSIDPPSLSDLKAGPARSLIVLGALLAALLLFVLGTLAKLLWSQNIKAGSKKD